MNPGTPRTDAAPPVCYICHDPADAPWADWIARQLADYQVPPRLVGRANKRGEKVSATIAPVHVAALDPGADLPEAEAAVLLGSRHLLVICSPQAARSAGIDACIRRYKVAGGTNHILAMVVEGEPNATSANRPEDECFPVALRHHVEPDGTIGKRPAEPIAADLRVTGQEHGYTEMSDLLLALQEQISDQARISKYCVEYAEKQKLGRLKVVAGLLGITLGELTERDKAYQAELDLRRRRQARRRRLVIGVASLIGAASAGYAVYKVVEASNVRTNIVTASVTLVAVKREYSELSEREQEAENNLLYQRGLDMMAETPEAAMACLRTPAARGYDPARHALGMALVNRTDKPEALAEGVELVRTASANGFAPAMADMAHIYDKGRLVGRDKGEALRLATAAAEKGNPAGMSLLATMLERKWCGPERAAEAFALYEKAAKLGDPEALFALRNIHEKGNATFGVSPNPILARSYMHKAEAAGAIGMIMERSARLLTEKNEPSWLANATALLKRGADQGDAFCMSMLGSIYQGRNLLGYQNGNIEMAKVYLTKAAMRGEPQAAFALGTIYEFEYPPGREKDKARLWFKRAADAGDGMAAAHLALLHINGIGGPVDKAEGLKYLRQTVEDPEVSEKFEARLMFGMLAIIGTFDSKEIKDEALGGYEARKADLHRQEATLSDHSRRLLEMVERYDKVSNLRDYRTSIRFLNPTSWSVNTAGEVPKAK